MLIEIAVFGHQQGFDQLIREAAAGQEQALLTICGLQHSDQFRIEAEETEFTTVIHVFNFSSPLLPKVSRALICPSLLSGNQTGGAASE